MGNELRPGKRFQHSVEAFVAAVEDSVTGSLRYLPEVDLNGYVQVRSERIHALHLGSIALDLILDLSQPESAVLNGFRQQDGGFRLRHVGTDEPHEPARMLFSQRPRLVDRLHACEQDSLGNAAAVNVGKVRFAVSSQMEMDVEHRPAPFIPLLRQKRSRRVGRTGPEKRSWV